jgi:hypothetical protein
MKRRRAVMMAVDLHVVNDSLSVPNELWRLPSTEYVVETEDDGSLSVAYDYSSIMHYYSRVFANEELVHDDPNDPGFYPLAVL